MTSERLFNSFIPPKTFIPPPKKKILATPLSNASLQCSTLWNVNVSFECCSTAKTLRCDGIYSDHFIVKEFWKSVDVWSNYEVVKFWWFISEAHRGALNAVPRVLMCDISDIPHRILTALSLRPCELNSWYTLILMCVSHHRFKSV